MREIQLKGKIASLSGACPAIVFVLKERTVYTTASTSFSKDRACTDLKNGTDVEVRGFEMSDSRIRADQIRKD